MTHDAFIQSIVEAPDDDAPRLVYADWLEERGDDLGPFIRLQVQLAGMPEDDPRRPRLEAEEARLGSALRQAAQATPRPPWALKGAAWALRDGWGFHRGLIGRLSTTATRYAAGAEALHRAAPVQRLMLRNVSACRGNVFRLRELRHVRALDLSANKLSASGARALCESPYLRGLKELTLRGCRLRIAEANLIASTRHLSGLEALRLGGNNLHDAGPEALLASPHLSRLRELDLMQTQLGPRGVTALGRSASLERLDLGINRLDDEGMRRLAGAAGLQRLTHLGLTFNQVTAAGAAALLTSTALPALAHLDLTGNVQDGAMLAVTPSAPRRGRLCLRLGYNGYQEPEALAGSPLIAACVGLDISSHTLGPAHVRALFHSSSAAGLRSLRLAGQLVSVQGLAALGEAGVLPRLEELSLFGHTWYEDMSLALLNGALLPRLRRLEIWVNDIPQRPEALLNRAGELAHLDRLRLSLNFLTWDEGGGALREALGWRLWLE